MLAKPDLTAEICELLASHEASISDGVTAIAMALVMTLLDEDVSKEDALKYFADTWDLVELHFHKVKAVRNGL